MKRTLFRIGLGAVGLAGLLAVATAAFYGWSQSESGRVWLAGRIAQIASIPGEREVTVGHIGGDFYRRILLRDVSVKDPTDAWLEIRSAEIQWRPWQLLRGVVYLQKIRISGLRVDRRPAATNDGEEAFAGLRSIRRLPALTVSAFDVEDLTLGARVLGAEAVLQIKGMVESDRDGIVGGTLSVQRGDGPLGKAHVNAAYRPGDNHLDIDLDIAEPAGGLIARALGMAGLPAVQGSLKGHGPLAAWQARAAVTFEGAASASADIAIQSGDGLTFQVTGAADVAAQGANPPGSLLSGSHRYRVSGRYDAEGILEVDAADWDGETFQLRIDGRVNTGDLAVDARGTVQIRQGRTLPVGSPHAEVGQLTLQATLTKTLLAPDLALTFEVGRLAVPGIAVAGLKGQAAFRSTGIQSKRFTAGEVTGSGSIAAIDIATEPKIQEILRRPVDWKIAGNVDLERALIRVRSLSLANAFASLSGTGSLTTTDGTGGTTLALRIADLRPVGAAFGQPIAGRAKLSIESTFAAFGDAVDAKLSGGLSDLDPSQPVAKKLVAGDIRLGGSLALKSGELVLRDVSVASDAASVHIEARIALDREEIEAKYRIQVPEGMSLGPADDVEIWCGCTVAGEVAGPLRNPRLDGDLVVKALAIQRFRFDAVSSHFDLRRLATAPSGLIRASARTEFGPVSLRTNARLAEDVLRFTAIHADGVNATLQGAVAIPIAGTPLTGDMRFKVAKLKPMLKLAGLDGGGEGTARIELSANGKRQRADVTADFSNFHIGADARDGVGNAKRLSVIATSQDLFASNQVSAAIEISDAVVGAATFKRISINAKGSLERAEIGVAASGRWIDPLSAEAALVFSGTGNRYGLTIGKLSGRALGRKISIGRPLRIHWDKNVVSVDAFALALGDARATASVKLTGDSLAGSASLANFPLAVVDRLWSSGLAGTLHGSATLQGTRAEPRGTLTAEVSKLRLARESRDMALGLAVSGDWRGGRLVLKGRLSNPGTPPATVNADLPLRLAPGQWNLLLPRNDPIAATATWKGDAATIWKFLPFAWHQFAGPSRMKAQLSGTLARPKIQGWLNIKNGSYESLQLGTVLKPLNLTVKIDGDKARLAQFTAGDGASGKMTAAGFVTLDPTSRYRFELNTTLKSFGVARRDDFEASASGKIAAKGTLDEAKISGRLKTESVELRILDQLPPDVVDLEVTKEGETEDRDRQKLDGRSAQFDPVLDVVVEMPKRVFVRGRGIESEWKGNLTVAGTFRKPRVSGSADVVQGQISVIGKVFRVQKGSVSLPEGSNAEPEILLTATHEGKGLTAEAKAEGPISKPKITLSSSPELPQDEIVAQILLDKSAATLSAIEGAQLAVALAQLSGVGGGGGVMELARKTLGVDMLRIETATTSKGDQTTVGAGKYLTQDVYFGGKQGATSESGSVGVEVDLTPNITVESEVRRSGANDVGVKFKLDY